MTGWGQDGPLAGAAGHDLNYIALSGALHMIGRPGEKPVPPLNLVGDFGGGGMLLAFGMLCALLHAGRTGIGQVVDAAMIDGANALLAMFHGFHAAGLRGEEPGTNFLSGAAHYYDTYETRDGKYVSIASIEPKFYERLIELAGLDRKRFMPGVFRMEALDDQQETWAALKKELTAVFKRRTRDEWCEILQGSDACFAPVLTLSEAPDHEHNRARDAFVRVGGGLQAAPAPRFSRTQAACPSPGVDPGTHSRDILRSIGYAESVIEELIAARVVFSPATAD
jgi:alpha-methylacyl-CoA racemase